VTRIRHMAPWAAAMLALAGVAAALLLTGGSGPPFVTAGGLQLRGGTVAPVKPSRSAVGWCGTDAAAEDRHPDAVAGRQIHVIYAFPSDGADRFASLAGPIASDVAAMDAWWRRQDPSRTLRFDLFAFPGCAPGTGQLDISRVQLQQPGGAYADTSTRAARIIVELDRTFVDPAKKYLVYYDGAVQEPRICGQSILLPDEGGRYAYSLVYAQACRADIGTGVVTANVAVHELTHNLGAVPSGGPPDACPGDSAHVCDDPDDLMYPYTRGQGLNPVRLDAGHNDYYEHGQGWWDLRNSTWLEHLDAPHHLLNVSLGRSTGSGQVTSDLPGIACPPACSASWDEGSTVTLTATAGEGSRFAGWSGACSSEPCTVKMGTDQTAVALFAAQVDLTVVVRRSAGARGKVTSTPAGIACPPSCTTTLDKDTRIRLTAIPGQHSVFMGWTGACAGKGTCTVPLSADSNVRATFTVARTPLCRPAQQPTKAKPCSRR
jgi:Divergent InlB B-repeat domain